MYFMSWQSFIGLGLVVVVRPDISDGRLSHCMIQCSMFVLKIGGMYTMDRYTHSGHVCEESHILPVHIGTLCVQPPHERRYNICQTPP